MYLHYIAQIMKLWQSGDYPVDSMKIGEAVMSHQIQQHLKEQ